MDKASQDSALITSDGPNRTTMHMATKLQVSEQVFVPRARLGLDGNAPNAFFPTTVFEVQRRSVRVGVGNDSQWVATSAVHRNIGVLICRIGDFSTEWSLLDPLAKSILQYFRLLLPDDMVMFCEVRSLDELQQFWTKNHRGCSHLVLIGHGDRTSLRFAVNGDVAAAALGTSLSDVSPAPAPKTVVSLCCSTGYASFGQAFSRLPLCGGLIAPFHSVHGAIASQFCQTFFAYHLLQGETTKVAFKHARKAIPGGTIFRLWQKGVMTGDL